MRRLIEAPHLSTGHRPWLDCLTSSEVSTSPLGRLPLALAASAPLAARAVFAAAFSAFSSCVRHRARAAAVEHFHVDDVSIVGDSRELRFTGDCQA